MPECSALVLAAAAPVVALPRMDARMAARKAQVPEPWLKAWLSASCDVLPRLRPQELTMSLWGVAAAGGSPHKAWLMLWFLVSRATMGAAGAQDLSLWLYSLAVLKLTPSPLWCSSYVEASYDKLTDAATRPQVRAARSSAASACSPASAASSCCRRRLQLALV